MEEKEVANLADWRMEKEVQKLADRLICEHRLSLGEYETMLRERTPAVAAYLRQAADEVRRREFGAEVYIRGLIEISNYCKNDCLYCGIRKSNQNITRYRLEKEEILSCCEEGYALGYRTFVLQGGEDAAFGNAQLAQIISEIKSHHPDCAVTLSMGEKSKESYQRLYDAGADRYLLRHETADEAHYRRLHPEKMDFSHRMECLNHLRDIGYQVGCGFMVGSPFQTEMTLAKDLKFIEEFSPEMCGIGPFIPQHDTPFRDEKAGTLELTLYLLSILRLMHPRMLIPATTALSTIDENGREEGLSAGANVIMPNLSPISVRKHYALYDNKRCIGEESAQCRTCIEDRVRRAGYRIVVSRGDYSRAADSK